MLASIINSEGDILIFLKDEDELKNLENASLKGEIFEFQDVRKIYPLELRIKDKNKGEYPNGAEAFLERGKYSVCLDKSYYKLKQDKWLGGRFCNIKFDIMTEDYAKGCEEFARDLRFVKSKYENREKIIEKMKDQDYLNSLDDLFD